REPERQRDRRRHAAQAGKGRLRDGAGEDGALVHPDRRHAGADVDPPAARAGRDVVAMNRREAIGRGGLALIGLGVGACRTGAPLDRRAAAVRPARNLAPVIASWDRVIRTTVGLRPHRPSGFVLRAEKLDDKTLIHNYGHSGAGMSIAWGCGVLVSEFALQT